MDISIAGILGLSITIFLGFLIWRITTISKKNGDSIGETLNQFLLQEGELLLIVILILCYLSEAMIATSLHPKDEMIIDVAARFVSHISINLLGFLTSALATKFLIDFFKSLKYLSKDIDSKGHTIRKANWALPIVLGMLSFIFLFSSFIIPYYNANIIAVGLDKSHEFEYAVNQIMFFWKNDAQVAREFGYDAHMSVGKILGYNMLASFVVFIAHLLGSIAEGLLASLNNLVHNKPGYIDKYEANLIKAKAAKTSTDNKNTDLKEEDKPRSRPEDKTRPKPKPDESETKEISLYKTILSIFEKDDDWIGSMVDKIKSSFNTLDIDDIQAAHTYLNKVATSIKTAKKKRNNDEYTDPEYKSVLKGLKDEIRIFIEKPIPEEGLGLTMDLEE